MKNIFYKSEFGLIIADIFKQNEELNDAICFFGVRIFMVWLGCKDGDSKHRSLFAIEIKCEKETVFDKDKVNFSVTFDVLFMRFVK